MIPIACMPTSSKKPGVLRAIVGQATLGRNKNVPLSPLMRDCLFNLSINKSDANSFLNLRKNFYWFVSSHRR
jgi:hypothetical protein